ncbi:MAG TPA: guanylate kinase [Chitinophagaceae bacterium]
MRYQTFSARREGFLLHVFLGKTVCSTGHLLSLSFNFHTRSATLTDKAFTLQPPSHCMKRYNKIIILTAPSGSGKTSITRYLLDKIPTLAFSISAATRQPRGQEQHGRDYYFITPEEFKRHIKNDDFIEWEMVYEGKYYGTLKSELERIWSEGRVPVLDIDVHGGIHVQQEYPINTLSIFIKPPSVDELRRRLLSRGTETAESIETRVNKAAYELSFADQFRHVVVNDDLDTACKQAEEIVREFLQRD